jgi:hypothetical protein
MRRDHPIVKLVSGANQRINAAWQDDLAEQETTKKSAIQKAVDSRKALQSGRVYRVLNSTPFAVTVVMLELVNIGTEMEAFDQTEREKGAR